MIDKIIFEDLPYGKDGVIKIIETMKKLILETDKNRIIKTKAKEIVKDIPPQDWKKQIEAIFNWVKNNVKYIKDYKGYEEITRPDKIIEGIEQGINDYSSDCDDIATLLGALLRSIGFKIRLEAVALKGLRYDHARVSIQNPETHKWIVLEGTSKSSKVGDRFPSKLVVLGLEL